MNPTAKPTAALRWLSTGRRGTAYDWLGGRGSMPLHVAGLGLVAAGETRLDDAFLPQRPSRGRQEVLGRSFGWRNDNHVLGWAKLAPIESPQAFSVEVMGSRVVSMPYDPMITWNDSVVVYFSTRRANCARVHRQPHHLLSRGDHQPMTDARRTAVAQATRLLPGSQWHVALSGSMRPSSPRPASRRKRVLNDADKVRFGDKMDPVRDAFAPTPASGRTSSARAPIATRPRHRAQSSSRRARAGDSARVGGGTTWTSTNWTARCRRAT